MDSKDDRLPSSPGFPMHYVPSYHSNRRSLPPLSAVDPHHALPSYPSSTLHYYYPSSHQVALYSHLPPAPHISHPFFSNPPHGGASGILPSVSQSHVPSIRRTPSSPSGQNLDNLNDIPASTSPHLAAHFHNPSRNSPRLDDRSQNISTVPPHLASVAHSHTLSSHSPLIDFSQHQPAPYLAAPQPVPAPFLLHLNPFPLILSHKIFVLCLLLLHPLLLIYLLLLILLYLLRRMFPFLQANMTGDHGTLQYGR